MLVPMILDFVKSSNSFLLSLLFLTLPYTFLPILFAYITSRFGGEPGELFLQLRVIDKSNNTKLTFLSSLKRTYSYLAYSVIFSYLVKIIPAVSLWWLFEALLALLPLLPIIWDPMRQSWFDKVSGAIVVNINPDYVVKYPLKVEM